ncbi:hypothetical protein RD792_010003 [Penstemon davidsonii]|uniref:Pentatricopeptide repeat-containing protein n=1 Tax=Penstemon davidsonii TaxID=160366 RepID=A0ABR0D1Z5_9LAMI|nr:hypothetical protein RD792_010003 [Penstemon davidsonii]
MFMNFQHSDTNCLHIFNSPRTTPPSARPSLKIKIPTDEIKHNQQKQVLDCPNGGGKLPKKNRIFRNPRRKNDQNDIIGGGFGTQSGVLKKEIALQGDFSDNPDRRIEKNGSLAVVLKSGGVFNGVIEEFCPLSSPTKVLKNGVFRKEKATQNGFVRKLDEKIVNNQSNGSETGAGGLVEKVHTKCSTKWARYGGSIPAMLEALDMISDIDEALKPWEMTLTNKERSILLKEQIKWERALEIFEWFRRKGCYEVNIIHYNIMIRILGKSRQWCEVERLWGEMEKRGIKPINSTYGTLIDVYSKGGMREKAMKWLELMEERKMEPDEVTMGIVLQMYKKAGDLKTAEEFFKKWSCSKHEVECDSSLSTYSYNTLIDTYGKAGKLKEASETFENMLKKGIKPTTVTFNSMIHMYGNNGQLEHVASLMRTMEKVKCSPDIRTYNILIFLHAKHNYIEKAANFLTKMKNASLEPDAVSYRTLLYAFAIRHMVAEAEQLISEMDEKGLEIDEYTQSSLTRMYIEAGVLEKSWSWFQRFRLGGNMTSDCYSANIDAFGERGYVSEAEKIFNFCIEEKKFNVLVFNVMIKAYGISKKFEQACCLFDSMKSYGLVPDKCSYNSLVQMLASSDLPEKAKSYLRKMQEAELVIDCVPYCAVISSYAKLSQMDMAVRLYEEMIGYGIKPDVIVYGVLINAFADTGGIKQATYFLNAMKNLGLPMNVVICKSLIKLYTKVGYVKEAQEAYGSLKLFEANCDVYSSNCMIDLYSERSMVSEAEEIFENMKGRGVANEFTYAMMLCMYKRNGRFVEAFWIARKMRELGFMTDLLSYNHVLGLYASDGRFKEAAATFREMQKSSIRPDDSTFKSLGIILLKCGVPKDAVEKLELIRKKDIRSGLQAWSSTLSSVIDVDDDEDIDD